MTTLSNLLVWIAGIGIVIMLVLVTADVFSRTLLNMAIPGTDTIVASYLMVATIFLPLAIIELLDENIAVDIVRDNVPDLMKDLFDILAHLLAGGFYLILAWIYYEVAVEAFERKEFVTGTWDVPIWPARIFMPVGLFVAALAALMKLFLAARALITGATPASHDKTGAL